MSKSVSSILIYKNLALVMLSRGWQVHDRDGEVSRKMEIYLHIRTYMDIDNLAILKILSCHTFVNLNLEYSHSFFGLSAIRVPSKVNLISN